MDTVLTFTPRSRHLRVRQAPPHPLDRHPRLSRPDRSEAGPPGAYQGRSAGRGHARVTADLYREDFEIEGYAQGRVGFELSLPAHLLKPREGYKIAVRVKGPGLHLPDSPYTLEPAKRPLAIVASAVTRISAVCSGVTPLTSSADTRGPLRPAKRAMRELRRNPVYDGSSS